MRPGGPTSGGIPKYESGVSRRYLCTRVPSSSVTLDTTGAPPPPPLSRLMNRVTKPGASIQLDIYYSALRGKETLTPAQRA